MGAQKRQYLVELGIEHSIGHTLSLLANLISRHVTKAGFWKRNEWRMERTVVGLYYGMGLITARFKSLLWARCLK